MSTTSLLFSKMYYNIIGQSNRLEKKKCSCSYFVFYIILIIFFLFYLYFILYYVNGKSFTIKTHFENM